MQVLFHLLLSSLAVAHTTESIYEEFKDMVRIYEEGSEAEMRGLAEKVKSSGLAAIVSSKNSTSNVIVQGETPFVLAHGMGDSCFNPGMKSITTLLGQHKNVYSVCVPTGSNWLLDTIDGFLKNMDKSIDDFAATIKKDEKLANGFNCVGFSQGNSLCRGYIQKYNDPPVLNFLSVHGTVSGVAGFPQCDPKDSICRVIAGLCGDLAYNPLVQGILFQADYFRHPGKTDTSSYKKYSQLAQLNNEGNTINQSYKENFASVKQYVMVKAEGDTMVYPNDGEWWGVFADGSYKTILQMKDTPWYKEDLFGLATADKNGAIHFESTPGNHLQFSEKDLLGWVDKYNL